MTGPIGRSVQLDQVGNAIERLFTDKVTVAPVVLRVPQTYDSLIRITPENPLSATVYITFREQAGFHVQAGSRYDAGSDDEVDVVDDVGGITWAITLVESIGRRGILSVERRLLRVLPMWSSTFVPKDTAELEAFRADRSIRIREFLQPW